MGSKPVPPPPGALSDDRTLIAAGSPGKCLTCGAYKEATGTGQYGITHRTVRGGPCPEANPIRQGDTVTITRGEHTGQTGRVVWADDRRGYVCVHLGPGDEPVLLAAQAERRP